VIILLQKLSVKDRVKNLSRSIGLGVSTLGLNLGLALGLSVSSTAQAQEISLTTTDWAPFYGSSLDRGGFVSAIVAESLKASGYTSNIVFSDWTEAFEKVKVGEKDMLVGAYFSEERARDFHISIPIYSLMTGVIKKQEFPLNFVNSFDELNKYKLGKIDGSVVGKSFDAYSFNSLTGYPGVADGLKALDQGQIDLYIDSVAVVKQVATDLGMDSSQLQLVQPPLEENDLYVLISKNIPNAIELRDAFNAGFIQIQANGTYETILKDFNQI
jgi:polar amino acid transport system substrate-binding protein